MNYLSKLQELNLRRGESAYSERIVSELIYLDAISKADGGMWNSVIEAAADYLLSRIAQDGVICRDAVAEAESLLSPMRDVARRYNLLFISHAHIDMNWMWGYNETAAVTVDTFRTILDLMAEYPEFTFAQSQASTYEIIEKYAPEMLPEIRQRIAEGRWEVTASEWVEPDKNMPDGESLTRQILQTKRYLSKLLEIPEAFMDLCFVPDTFGHNANVPEILAGAGIRYFYHCRGYETPCIYRFAAPSGASVLTSREYSWYNADITPEKFEIVPTFCKDYGLDTMLAVYGVGDHGGGPTRRDIERILKYAEWPYTPKIRFGTFREYFRAVEAQCRELPCLAHELNFVFTGCYTTQSRIKMANRIGEARLNECEALMAMDNILAGGKNSPRRLDGAWQKLIFNHFHDILPGSGTIETREFALGRFQELMADVSTASTAAIRHLMSRIDTTSIPFDGDGEDRSEGAGVGYFQDQKNSFRLPSAERGRGKVRALLLANPTPWPRDEYSEIVIWDYPLPLSECEIRDGEGNSLPFAEVGRGSSYWGHKYHRILLRAPLSPYGYTTVVLSPKNADGHMSVNLFTAEHADHDVNDNPIILENALIRAEFDPETMEIRELIDRRSGENLITAPTGWFRFAEENPVYNMTSWRVGPIMKSENLNRTHAVRRGRITKCEHYTAVDYTIEFEASTLFCTVQLNEGSSVLEFSARVDWKECGEKGKRIPQLAFMLPGVAGAVGKAMYAIPYGRLIRPEIAHDVPSIGMLGVIREGSERTLGLLCDTKYGFRMHEGTASVTLIRSACDPDPYPERDIHNIRIGIALCGLKELKSVSDRFNHPIAYASFTRANEGQLPLSGSAVTVSGAEVSCLKCAEDESGITLRLCETEGKTASATVTLCREIDAVHRTDDLENEREEISFTGNSFTTRLSPHSVETFRIRTK